jgi:hypothetical protein
MKIIDPITRFPATIPTESWSARGISEKMDQAGNPASTKRIAPGLLTAYRLNGIF